MPKVERGIIPLNSGVITIMLIAYLRTHPEGLLRRGKVMKTKMVTLLLMTLYRNHQQSIYNPTDLATQVHRFPTPLSRWSPIRKANQTPLWITRWLPIRKKKSTVFRAKRTRLQNFWNLATPQWCAGSNLLSPLAARTSKLLGCWSIVTYNMRFYNRLQTRRA